MNLAGEMDRAFAVDRIPAGGVGRAVKLGLEAHADNGRGGFKPNHFFGGLPGRPAGRPAHHFDRRNDSVFSFDEKLRGAEQFTVVAETDLPRKTTSGWRGNHQSVARLFPGRHDRNTQLGAEVAQIHGKIRVPEKIQDEVGLDSVR